ncbi:MAG: polysaccharide deacetylase family protein [Clostridiales bacterium]|nr:polysaccharide deacetylase family protein [Clostridiales bacterium]
MRERQFTVIVTNFAIILVLSLLLVSTLYTNANATFRETDNAIYTGNKESNKVTLMINVYWGTEYIEPMMELIKENGFTTTFFIGGKWAESNATLLKKMAEEGFEIANHGYLHRDHSKLNYSANREEILITERLIKASTGVDPAKLFAPPSGARGKTMFEVCDELGYKVIMWTRDTIDWRDHDAGIIYDRAVKNMAGGDLILMHPTKETLEALPNILKYIKDNGFVLTTVSDTISQNSQ